MNKKLLLHEHDNHTERLKLSQNKTDVIIAFEPTGHYWLNIDKYFKLMYNIQDKKS